VRSSILNTSKNVTVSVEKAKNELGYEPFVERDIGMKETLKWFQENYKK
jgi:nucleoside-diphosphate-sugar epimerase